MDTKTSKIPRGVGRPRNSPGLVTRQLAIRLTEDDREALRPLAEEAGLPIATYIVAVLRAHIDASGS